MTAAILTSQLRNWNQALPQTRKSLMNDYQGIKPITNLEIRIKAKEAFDRLLDLEVYAYFLTLSAKDLLND